MTSWIRRVGVEGVLVPDGFRRVALDARGRRRCRGRASRATRRASRTAGSTTSGGKVGQVADRPHPVLRERPCAVFSPTPHSREIGSGARKAASSPGGTTTSPSGLRRSEPIFATSFVVATPTEAVSPTSSRVAALIARAIASPIAEQRDRAGDVEECLVDRDRLHLRGEPTEDRHHVARRLLVAPPVDRQEDPVRAAPDGLGERHRRVDAERPCLVARGRDDPATAWVAADDDRQPAQLRPIALLDGGEEGIEVDVQDRADHRPGIIAPPVTR